MPTPRRLPRALEVRTFTVAEAVGKGVHPERLRRSDLVAPVRGVRAPAGSADFFEAVAQVMRPDQYFSHTTAARLWGAPLPASMRSETAVHVTTVENGVRMRRPNVVGHRRAEPEVVEHRGHRVSAPSAMWFECAASLDVPALVAVGDHLVGRSGLATIDDLRAAVLPGSRYVRRARSALDRIRVGAESAMETWLRLAVEDAGFPEPELNLDVHDPSGLFLGRVDLVWPALRIGLEYDGDHHRERDAFRHDQRRDNGFVVNDWLIIHATAADAGRPAVLLERLRQAFEARTVTIRLRRT
ncbi:MULTISPECIES: hypothetical protein [unclassified Curtobacterium]|uniref:hypothetical protein n=1 Tax=unclassified Curtobacterium TaxID=257496 RepID=UPI00135A7F7F|nr:MULTISPECIES: hypothetical protein [unclassified Curtobacterium]MBF4587688.1 hypothetical protein [Curtobacterium sp. VKM Ac-2887]